MCAEMPVTSDHPVRRPSSPPEFKQGAGINELLARQLFAGAQDRTNNPTGTVGQHVVLRFSTLHNLLYISEHTDKRPFGLCIVQCFPQFAFAPDGMNFHG